MSGVQLSVALFFWGSAVVIFLDALKAEARWRRLLLGALTLTFIVSGFLVKPLWNTFPDVSAALGAIAVSPISWFVLAVVAYLGLRRERGQAAPSEAQRTDRQRQRDAINENMAECMKSLGMVIHTDQPLQHTLALSTIEAFIIDLGRRNDFMIPELRRDGEQAGNLRAAKYLADMNPLLQLNDLKGARERAAQLAPRLNEMSVPQLKEMLGINGGGLIG